LDAQLVIGDVTITIEDATLTRSDYVLIV